MKALNVLKSPIVEIGSDSDLNLHSKAVVLFATREQIQEAIAELEAQLQAKDERIKELECRADHAEAYVKTHSENYRKCDGCFYTLTIPTSMEEIARAQEACYSCQRYYSDKFRLKTIEEKENT